MKDTQHQILFNISYKTFIFKDINLPVTLDHFWLKWRHLPFKNFGTPSNLIIMT